MVTKAKRAATSVLYEEEARKNPATRKGSTPMNYTLYYTCQDCSWSAEARAEGMPIKFFSSGIHPTQPAHAVWLEITQEAVHSGN